MHQSLTYLKTQSLHLTFQLQRALSILQMSQIELSSFLDEELEKNPLLKEKRPIKERVLFQEIAEIRSLADHLALQIRENFSTPEEKSVAMLLIDFLDEKGFLTQPLDEIISTLDLDKTLIETVLATLKTFHPPGIFARNLQECLLIQLKLQGLEQSDVFCLIEKHFTDFLHGRYFRIQKNLKNLDIADAIHKLTLLQMRPLDAFKHEIASPIIADVKMVKTAKGFRICLEEDFLQIVQIDPQYEKLHPHSQEEKATLRLWKTEGKWLLYALQKRKEIVLRMSTFIAEKQTNYLSGHGNLVPLTVQEIGEHLGIHPTTVSRALMDKYIDTPRGILSLKSLVNHNPKTIEAKDLLQEIVKGEDPHNPLRDEEIVEKMKNKGILVARRTVAKYRHLCKIPTASVRKVCKS